MDVALFVPCYIDQLYPGSASPPRSCGEQASGCTFPRRKHVRPTDGPTPASSTMPDSSRARCSTCSRRTSTWSARSASCTAWCRNHYPELLPGDPSRGAARRRASYASPARRSSGRRAGRFDGPGRSAPELHALRELRMGSGSERLVPPYSKTRALLEGIEGPRSSPTVASGRVLRIRRHLRRQRGAVSCAWDATGGPTTSGGRRGDHRRGQLLPHALDAADRATARSFASCTVRRAAGGSDPMSEHSQRAGGFVATSRACLARPGVVWFVRNKRDIARSFVPEWEELRSLASQIKAHTLSRLPDLPGGVREERGRRGRRVTGRATPVSTTASCTGCCASAGVTRLVRASPCLTESPPHEHLERTASRWWIPTWGSDRAVPARAALAHRHAAIHLKKEEIGELFHQKLGTPAGLSIRSSSPRRPGAHAREIPRRAGGAHRGDFAVASTGGVVVAPTKATRTWARRCGPSTFALHGSGKDGALAGGAGGVSSGCWRAAPRGQPITTSTRRISRPASRGGDAHVIADNGRSRILAPRSTGIRSSASVAPLA